VKPPLISLILILSLVYVCHTSATDGLVKHLFLYHSTTAKTVSVAGSFNNWSADANPLLSDGKGEWKAEVNLPANYYLYKIVVDGVWIPDPENSWKINDGGAGFNSIVKVGNPPKPQRKSNPERFPKEELPEPVLENDPQLVELYYATWQMAWNKIQHGTPENGFAPSYMDEGFNELIYQWDMCFITSYAIYGRNVFPVMPSLDNFYGKQRSDGYIQRVYWETTGKPASEPTREEPMINPPLFAWVEWRYYQISGDTSRIRSVLPILTKYYEWIEKNCSTEKSRGLFYNTGLGSGMDNIPRRNVGTAAYIDLSAQQALAALCIANLSQVAGDEHTRTAFLKKHAELRTKINSVLWNDTTHFYYDLTEDGSLSRTMHIGAFWTLLAEAIPEERLPLMIAHLMNPDEFKRQHLLPTLAANQPEYDPRGHYWLGGVWAPTNYMTIKGMMAQKQFALADSIAFNHLRNISSIYYNFKPDSGKISFEERYADSYHTIWEAYAPDALEPATRWDNTLYTRQDFAGWTGLAPIALLIENVLGFDICGNDNLIRWTIKRSDRHGIKKIQLRDQSVSLLFDPNNGKPTVRVTCEKPFRLTILYLGNEVNYTVTQRELILPL